jgi:hypothetical protein
MIACVFMLTMLAAGNDHAAANPLLQELLTQGIVLKDNVRAKLPQPTLADGLDEASQQATLSKILGDRYSSDEFARNAVVSPYVLKFSDVRNGEVVARGVDLWFIVYGDLNDLAHVEVLEKLSTGRGRDTTLHTLSAGELEARKLPAADADHHESNNAPDAANERFVHTVASIMDRVELHQTSRCMLSRTADSVLIASIVDRRFDVDREFPNAYHRLERSDLGETTKDAAQPYSGAGSYLKATILSRPAGAILVEYHMTYSEPRDWFNGANLLQSKLPILLQARIRELRRELKASATK